MDLLPSPDADRGERALGAVRRIVVPVAAALLVVAAVVAGSAAEADVVAHAGLTRADATIVGVPEAPGAPARVAWPDARGAVVVAALPVPGEARVGRPVPVYLGPDGVPVPAPDTTGLRVAGVLRAAAVLVLGGIALAAVHTGARWAGRRRASRRIDREWWEFERRSRGHPAG